MRRALVIGLVLVLALAGFYVAWPAWTAYRIRQAIETNDPAALERRIDFASVRARAKPLIAAQMSRSLEDLQKKAGPLGAAIAGQLKQSLGTQLADAAVDSILTPANVIRVVRQGKDLRRVWKDITRERGPAGTGSGGTGTPGNQPAPATGGEPPAGQPKHTLTLANIRSYRITGPASIEVGVAHNPTQAEPDVVAELAFTGGDWKVVAIVPQL